MDIAETINLCVKVLSDWRVDFIALACPALGGPSIRWLRLSKERAATGGPEHRAKRQESLSSARQVSGLSRAPEGEGARA